MRRTPTHSDSHDVATMAAGGSTVRAFDFDSAYTALSVARANYDVYAGDPDRVPNLAAAAKQLGEARAAMAAVRAI